MIEHLSRQKQHTEQTRKKKKRCESSVVSRSQKIERTNGADPRRESQAQLTLLATTAANSRSGNDSSSYKVSLHSMEGDHRKTAQKSRARRRSIEQGRAKRKISADPRLVACCSLCLCCVLCSSDIFGMLVAISGQNVSTHPSNSLSAWLCSSRSGSSSSDSKPRAEDMDGRTTPVDMVERGQRSERGQGCRRGTSGEDLQRSAEQIAEAKRLQRANPSAEGGQRAHRAEQRTGTSRARCVHSTATTGLPERADRGDRNPISLSHPVKAVHAVQQEGFDFTIVLFN